MCRWSQQSESPLVYVSYGRGKLNAFDAEKKVLLFENVDDVPKYESKSRNFKLAIYFFFEFLLALFLSLLFCYLEYFLKSEL